MLNRKGAMSRQRGSMVLMVIFVMILFGFLSARLGLELLPVYVAGFGLLMICMVERAFGMARND